LLPYADAVDGALLRADELGCVRLAKLLDAAGPAAAVFLSGAVDCAEGRFCVTLVAGVTEAAAAAVPCAPETAGLVIAFGATLLPDTESPAEALAADFLLLFFSTEPLPSLSAPLSSLDIIIVNCLSELASTFCATPLRLGVGSSIFF
jgi:hypothetical protein